jgi:hypothetical protein
MNKVHYLKCSCQRCNEHIEFPSEGIGATIQCPHCGEQTALIPLPGKNPVTVVLIVGGTLIAILVFIAVGATFYLSRSSQPTATETTPVQNATPQTQADSSASAGEFTNVNDFKVSKIKLRKTEGSSLVYAVGTVKNDTNRQRFGVKIQLDLFDAQDVKIGSASDYVQILDPHKDWQFKALLTDPKTVSAKLVTVEEQK